MREVKMELGSLEVGVSGEGREWGLLSLLYTDDLVLSDESEMDLRVMIGRFC